MKYILTALITLFILIGYSIWLDSGCEIAGVMTWSGKVCEED